MNPDTTQHDTVEHLNTTMEEVVKPTLVRIETQVLKTNGSVRGLLSWKSYIQGGLTVICIVLLPIIFMVIQNYMTSTENFKTLQILQANIKK